MKKDIKHMKKNTTLTLAIILISTLVACNNNNSKQNPDATAPMVTEGGLKVAYIDTDTLLAKYQYAIDLEQQLKDYTEQQRHYGQQQVEAFQKDYNNYLQNGSTMTLTQQQAKEAELKQRAEKMQTLEQDLMAKIAEIYEEQVEDGLDHLISIVEPTLVALLSIVIGAILLSVMLPMAGVLSSM